MNRNQWWIPVAVIALIWAAINGIWWIPVIMVVVFLLTYMIMRKNKGPSYAEKK